jgi:hypothetical protein
VGEWKDGTQQYFDDAFVREWGRRMEDMDVMAFTTRPDADLMALAAKYGATHLVLPTKPKRPALTALYRNRSFAVYAVPAPGR